MKQYVWYKAPHLAVLIIINHLHYDAYFNIPCRLLTTTADPIMRAKQMCMSLRKLFTHTHWEILQHPTALQHEFQQLLSYLTVHHITAEKTVRKNKKHRIWKMLFTQITVLWIHPRAWKNKSLQYNHFSINVWKYFTAWCNKSVMRL